jgi:hypothetical protein
MRGLRREGYVLVEASHHATLVEALKPFAWIGQWMFARDLPDDTLVVEVRTLGEPVRLTRGMFKAAHTVLAKIGGDA